jgi:lysozyme
MKRLSVNQRTIDLITHFEGFHDRPYTCPTGHETFGYGSLLEHYPLVKFPIDEKTAMAYLRVDLAASIAAVNSLVKVATNDNQFGALVSFTQNMGSGHLAQSTLLKKLNGGDYGCVPEELSHWVYGNVQGVETVLPGLVKRRAAEGDLWQEAA